MVMFIKFKKFRKLIENFSNLFILLYGQIKILKDDKMLKFKNK